MSKPILFTALFLLLFVPGLHAGQDFEQDAIQTSEGELKITFIGHGTLMFEFKGMVIDHAGEGRIRNRSRSKK